MDLGHLPENAFSKNSKGEGTAVAFLKKERLAIKLSLGNDPVDDQLLFFPIDYDITEANRFRGSGFYLYLVTNPYQGSHTTGKGG